MERMKTAVGLCKNIQTILGLEGENCGRTEWWWGNNNCHMIVTPVAPVMHNTLCCSMIFVCTIYLTMDTKIK